MDTEMKKHSAIKGLIDDQRGENWYRAKTKGEEENVSIKLQEALKYSNSHLLLLGDKIKIATIIKSCHKCDLMWPQHSQMTTDWPKPFHVLATVLITNHHVAK